MTGITSFDATNIPPQQMGDKHPPGHFTFTIVDTEIQPTKAQDGGMFVVTFQSPAGTIVNRYNLWNKEPKAVEIAQKELSALCHATGVFKLSMSDQNLRNSGFELRGAQGTMEVGPQQGNDQYMEIKKVFDRNGNEPGKPPGNSAPQPQQGAWGGQTQQPAQTQQPQQQPTQQQPNANGGWGNPNQQQQPNNPPPNNNAAPQGWQPGPTQQQPNNQQQKPPWAS